ncbi:MAG: cyclopropane-fatty-acyl-phospholipid synthase family protein [Rhodovibrionaceae bacterium]|nr:cyclopropane-fatty-acyl-phospholipid synthase family protein [Rhodovibrionaceae bacterium]
MASLTSSLFNIIIKTGSLTVAHTDGTTRTYGDGGDPKVAIALHGKSVETSLALNPKLRIGEAYMDGRLTIEDGSLYDFIDLCALNVQNLERHGAYATVEWLGAWLRYLRSFNPLERAQKNVAHHYDLSGSLYDLFLDEDRQYSCAYFRDNSVDLETAQRDKKLHIAAKLRLERPGLRVLDIGCGWGGMALTLARESEAEVVGITLSREQLKVAQARAQEAGLSDRVEFRLQDYREVSEQFDRVVSVGMFEHVGLAHYGVFFNKVRDLLTEDGVALLHSIGTMYPPSGTNPWLRKYIFPGGYTPSLSEVMPAVERAGLWSTDIEILRLHYAETLRHWRQRFEANRDKAKDLFDERFCRMWEFYLAACEISFRRMGQMVFQLQMTRRQDAVPLTRDYITDWERERLPDRSKKAEAAE